MFNKKIHFTTNGANLLCEVSQDLMAQSVMHESQEGNTGILFCL